MSMLGKVMFGVALGAIGGYVVRRINSAEPPRTMVLKRSPVGPEVKQPGGATAEPATK
jgi:hypothetical protein